MATAPAQVSRSSRNIWFFAFLIVFIASLCALAVVISLDRTIERTAGKVIDTYSKTFVSKKKSFDQEYLIVQYAVGGKEYTGKTPRRTNSDFVPVFFYRSMPGMAWFYKKANPNMIYCCTFIALSLLGMILARPRFKKAPVVTNVKTAPKKK